MREEEQKRAGASKPTDAAKAARLKAALKANIAKRKAQARARQSGGAPPEAEKDVEG